ncbi:hypothetical protein A5700_12455 [Mycobacterium sp. E1214]|nr:hypothetical protein A5700_12455 [Mycobacterium sp. E1214]OBH29939.1 hypothetical protein A5693_18715 [Mycobacterium sp. E1319]
MNSEYLVLAAPSLETIEKYLYGRFGFALRSDKGLPHLRTPVLEELGYSCTSQPHKDRERFALVNAAGALIAIGSADRLTAKVEFKRLALMLTASIDEIESSMMDPDGKPLCEHE